MEDKLLKYVSKQLDFFAIDNDDENLDLYDIAIALDRMRFCLKHIYVKGYNGKFVLEDIYHTCKYTVFLYYLSNTVFLKSKHKLSSKIYALNKMLHGIDMYYELELPEIFMLSHPVGTVLGRAKYSNYFCIYQNCTVGGISKNNKFIYPEFDSRGGGVNV